METKEERIKKYAMEYKKKIYIKQKEKLIKTRQEILNQRPIKNTKNEKYLKETYFDNFRQVKVKDLLKDL